MKAVQMSAVKMLLVTAETFNMCHFMQDTAQIQVITVRLPIQVTPIPRNVKFPHWYGVFSTSKRGYDKLVQDWRGADV